MLIEVVRWGPNVSEVEFLEEEDTENSAVSLEERRCESTWKNGLVQVQRQLLPAAKFAGTF